MIIKIIVYTFVLLYTDVLHMVYKAVYCATKNALQTLIWDT